MNIPVYGAGVIGSYLMENRNPLGHRWFRGKSFTESTETDNYHIMNSEQQYVL